MTENVALVTGATSGIGKAPARTLRDTGFTAYADGRRLDRPAAIPGDRPIPIQLDVTGDASGAAAIVRRFAR